MSVIAQLIVVGLAVVVAVAVVVRASWKTWFDKTATTCGSGCGKCATPVAEPKTEGRFPLPQV